MGARFRLVFPRAFLVLFNSLFAVFPFRPSVHSWSWCFKKPLFAFLTFSLCLIGGVGHAQERRVVVVPSDDGFFVIPFWYTAPPPAPATINGTLGSNNTATISWSASAGATYYEVEKYNPDTGRWEKIYSGTATSITASNLGYGTNQFRVRACDDSKCGDRSATRTVNNVAAAGSGYYGTLVGEHAVAKDGSFSYSIPLELPVGINGVRPNLSLNYNSNRGNGLLGWGWQLNGLPSVSRCQTSRVRDDYVTGINPGESYRYCLDGERLVKVGTNEYRTETERFVRLSFHSSYWEMRDKNGTRTRFAINGDARRYDGAGQIREWHVSEVRDVNGNYYTVSYQNGGGNGVFMPTSISYTKNAAGGTNHSVNFYYQDRTDDQSKYVAGGRDVIDKRMYAIIAKTNGSQVYRYNLAYQTNGQTYDGNYFNDPAGISRLRSIQQCYASNAVCASALNLGWTKSNTSTTTISSRWSSTGGSNKNFTNAELSARGISANNIENSYIADVTGDQIDDYIVVGIASTSPTYKTVWYLKNGATGAISGIASYDNKTGPGEFSLTGSSAVIQVFRTLDNATSGVTQGQRVEPIFADVTGDGKKNIILPSDPLFVNTAAKPIPNGIVVLSVVNNKLVYHPAHSLGSNNVRYSFTSTGGAFNNANAPYRLVYQDFNGDGLTDILRHSVERTSGVTYTSSVNRHLSVALNTGNGFGAFQSWGHYGLTPFTNEIKPHVIDLNGDKLVDLVFNDYVAINSGSSFSFKSNWGISLDAGSVARGEHRAYGTNTGAQAVWQQSKTFKTPAWVDVNNDGLVDRVTLVSGGNNFSSITMKVQYNQGYKLTSEQSLASFGLPRVTHIGAPENQISLSDFNGDGLPDLITTRRDITSATYFDVRYRRGNSYGSPIRMRLINTSSLVTGNGSGGFNFPIVANVCNPRSFSASNLSSLDVLNIESNCGYQPDRNVDGMDDSRGVNPMIKHRMTTVASGSDYSVLVSYEALAKQGVYSLNSTNQNTSQFANPNQSISTNTSFDGQFTINAIDNLTNSPMAGRYAVAQIDESNGIGGNNTTTYGYENAKYHGAGYGNLGFSKRHENTYAGSTRYRQKEITYLQDISSQYNLAGYPLKERNWVRRSNGALGLTSTHDYQWQVRVKTDDVDAYNSPHFHAYQVASLSDKFDLETGSRVGREITKFAYDSSDRSDCAVPSYPRQITSDSYFYAQGVPKNVVKSKCDAYGVVGSRTENSNIQSFYAYGLPRTRKTTYWSPKSGSGIELRTQEVLYTYNSKGQTATERLEPNSGDNDVKLTRTYAYNAYGTASSTTESWTNTTNNGLNFTSRQTSVVESYPSSARQLVTTNPLGQVSTHKFDARFGGETYNKDVNNQIVSTSYDILGRVSKITEPNGVDTNVSYGVCSGCFAYSTKERWYKQSTRDGEGEVRMYFDGLDREVGTRARGLTNLFTYTGQSYDGLGRALQTIEPLRSGTQHKTTFSYDYLDRPRSTTFPNGGTQSLSYNVSGSAVVGGVSYAKPRVVTTDSLGRTTQKFVDTNEQTKRIVDAVGTDINYVYDPLGNLTEVELEGNKQIITYDQRSRKKQLTDPDIGTITYKYNPLGELGQETNNKGEVTRYQYDKLARQTQRTDDAGTANAVTQSYSYDGTNGKGLISAITGVDTQGNLHAKQFFYNGLGLLSELRSTIDGGIYSTNYTYDSVNRPDVLTYPTGFAVQHGYATTGQLKTIKNANTNTTYWQATADDARGNVTSATLGNGLVDSKTYDPKTGLINTAKATGNGFTAQDHIYQWDTEGNLTLRQDRRSSTVTQRFCYDSLNRIKKVTSGTCTNTNSNSGVDFAYSKTGNITNKQGVSYGYGAGSAGVHAATSAAGQTYAYNANGSMISGNNRAISYTSFGKPESITKGANSVTINYGADKSRVQRDETNASGTSLTTYVSHDLITTYEKVVKGAETKHLHYINAPNGKDNQSVNIALYTQTQTGGTITDKTIYHHRDHLGSIVAKTDDQGNLTSTTELLAYDTWGKRLNTNWNGSAVGENYQTEGNQRGYTDHEHLDSVGLIHMNGRVYDPELARFISPDPWIQDPYNTQSFNRYSYVWNNPLRYTDPTGEIIPFLFVAAKVIGYASAAYGAYEAASTVHDIATGEKSLEEGAKDLAVDAAITAVGGGLVKAADKLTPDAVRDQVKDKLLSLVKNGDEATESVSKTATKTNSEEVKSTRELRGGNFNSAKNEAEIRSDGSCEYCGASNASEGDHFIPLNEGKRQVNVGEATKAEVKEKLNQADNIVNSCTNCNRGSGGKGTKLPSNTQGDGKWVPPNPNEHVQDKLDKLDQ